MAQLIPSIGAARFDTRGELRTAERLKDFLEDNSWVWHNLPVGARGLHPDFIVLNPASGLLVLEVKDWRIDTLASASKLEVELLTDQGTVRARNPFEQARSYMFDVVHAIQNDPHLVFGGDHPLKGKPVVPFGFGVVFTNITRRQYEQSDLGEIFPSARCLFRDDMSESADPDRFREQIWRMVVRPLGPPLSMPQFDRLRALLFPEVRIPQLSLDLPQEAPARTAPNGDRTLAVMDLQQEQLARSLGEGHRILRGVAGSGKTLILAFRAEHVARAATRPVLVLCYGNGIAGRLENAMQDRGVEDRVQVSTFHAWCWRMARTYDVAVPQDATPPQTEDRYRATVRAIIDAVDRGQVPTGQYDAVLIDEAHDFEEDWLRLAARMVNPGTKSLMIAYDDMQAIYKGRARPVWSQLGIEAKGRTSVLRINYRNTAQILRFARRFAADILGAPGTRADDEDAVLLPEDAGREGLEPEVRRCVSYDGEGHAIAQWLRERHAAGYHWRHMAVLVPENHIGDRFAAAMHKLEIPVDLVRKKRNRLDASTDAVRLLSMHNAKGLEFPCVAVGGLGVMGTRKDLGIEDEVRLAYVAVTRATHEALLTYSRVSALVERLIA
jgi:hypothetical protein